MQSGNGSEVPKRSVNHTTPDVQILHRLSAVVPTVVGAAVAENVLPITSQRLEAPQGRTRSRSPKPVSHHEIHTPRVGFVGALVRDVTINDSFGFSNLLSCILDENTLDLGIAEGRAEVCGEAQIYREEVHHHYLEEFRGLAEEQHHRVLVRRVSTSILPI